MVDAALFVQNICTQTRGDIVVRRKYYIVSKDNDKIIVSRNISKYRQSVYSKCPKERMNFILGYIVLDFGLLGILLCKR